MMPPPRHDPAHPISELELAAVPAAVGHARRFTRRQLIRWRLDELIDDVELLVSELLSNAVKATGAFAAPASSPEPRDDRGAVVIVRFRLAGTDLYVEVSDSDPAPPVPADPAELDQHGRGLHLVAALSDDWGHYAAETGKTVWIRNDITGMCKRRTG
jgi:signal transduction histidine kinase